MKARLLTSAFALLLCSSFMYLNAQTRVGAVLETYGNGNGDRFGAALDISDDGTRLAVVSPDNGRFGSGNPVAAVFQLTNGSWTQLGSGVGEIFSTTINEQADIDISDDGTTVALGEATYNSVDHFDAGTVVVYRLVGGDWTAQGQALEGTFQDAQMGKTVLLNRDGSQVTTGMFAGEASDDRGAYVYFQDGSMWMPVGPNPVFQGTREIAVTGLAQGNNGRRLAVGFTRGPNEASIVHVYQYLLSSDSWVFQRSYTSPVNDAGFGESLATANNGFTVAVGAPREGNGAVRVFDANGNQIGQTLMGNSSDGEFGRALAMSENGLRLAVGAPNRSNLNASGRTVVYDFDGSSWQQAFVFEGTVAGEEAGEAVAMTTNGRFLAIGRPRFNAGSQEDAGQVDVFDLGIISSIVKASALDIRISPNPTSSILNIQGATSEGATVFIYDSVGRLSAKQTLHQNQVDVEHLSAGTYSIQLVTASGAVTLPFVKQ